MIRLLLICIIVSLSFAYHNSAFKITNRRTNLFAKLPENADFSENNRRSIGPLDRLKRAVVGASFAISSALPIFYNPKSAIAKKSADPIVSVGTLKSKNNKQADNKVKASAPTAATRRSAQQQKKKVVVEIDLVKDVKNKQQLTNDQLTKIGMALALATLLLTLLAPDNKPAPRKSAVSRRSSSPSPKKVDYKDLFEEHEDEDEDEGEEEAREGGASEPIPAATPERRQVPTRSTLRGAKSLLKLPEPDELFESAEDLYKLPEEQQRERREVGEEDVDAPVLERDLPPAPAAAPVVPATPEPPKGEEKKGIFSRIFQKPGGGRPTSLEECLANAGATAKFRQLVTRALLRYAPADCFSEVELASLAATDDATSFITAAKDSAGLNTQEAAESFAGIASAMMVAIVDRAVDLGDDRKGKKEDAEKAVVAALDEAGLFISAVGELFGLLFPGVKVEPVVYNGRAKRSKLEHVYFLYSKAAMNIASILAQAGAGEDSTADDRTLTLGKIQVVLGIKEAKRSSLEQKALREMFMSMAKGEGGGGPDMGALMDMFGGGKDGGGGTDFDPKALEAMMAEMGEGGGGLPEGMDPKNMSPEQLEGMTKEAMSAVKEGLEQGNITRREVEELERVMGVDIKTLVGLMDSGKVDKAKMKKEFGSDLSELLDIFKKLAQIK